MTSPTDVVQRARQALDGIETEGRWHTDGDGVWAEGRGNVYMGGERDYIATAEGGFVTGEFLEGDARFIAAAPDLVRDLADEVERLEADRDTGFRQRMGEHKLRAQRDQARTEAAKLRAVIERVGEVHRPIDALNTDTGHTTKVCSGCGTDNGNWAHWPCRTIRALDGEQQQ